MEAQPQAVAFYQNPFYDDIMLFMLDQPVPPKQRKGKAQRREFEKWFRGQFEQMRSKKVGWPYKERLMIVFSVTGPLTYLENVDIDNIAKAVLDGCKGIAFMDDKQVFSLIAEKHIQPKIPGLYMAIRKLQHGEFATFVPAMYSSDPNTWPADNFERVTTSTVN